MKFKLDENIGNKAAALLRDVGHDVSTVSAQALNGTSDENLFAICTLESRVLVTLDHDFGQVLRFPPEQSAGIVVLEVAPRAQAESVQNRIRDLIAMLSERIIDKQLWIVEPGRVRIHQPID